MSVYSSTMVYPSFFDDPLQSHEDFLYEQYRSVTFDYTEEDLREMYDEYYSCYEEWYLWVKHTWMIFNVAKVWGG